MLLSGLLLGVFGTRNQELKDGARRANLDYFIAVGRQLLDDDRKYFDDLSEEALVVDLPVFKLKLD